MTKHREKIHANWIVVTVLFGLLDLAVYIAGLLQGTDVALFHPKGLIAQQEFRLTLLATAVLLAIAIPSLFLFYFFAWKYRETNEAASYKPDTHHGKFFVFSIWAIPCAVMVVMAFVMWTSTHRLDPHTPIASNTKPLTIQVIAMRWKWVFVYPEQNIATVNFVEIPNNTPVRFELTADDVPMSSFWVPHLSGQLYAMTGHINDLNMIASTSGDYPGSSAEINGEGFAGMKFMVHATTNDSFTRWASATEQAAQPLDAAKYAELLKPSENNVYEFYSNPEANLYDRVVMKYMQPLAANERITAPKAESE